MRGRDFADLQAFVAITEHRSFARAAAQLRVSPSALSQTIRGLEERLGVRLLNRTTRSVAPTAAGERLLAQFAPALQQMNEALVELQQDQGRPAGVLRLNVPALAVKTLLGSLLGRFHEACPEIMLDIEVDDALADIVAGRFDAGIRIGERLDKDMIAVKIGPDLEMMAVGSPRYFERHGTPTSPADLHRHRCINWRWPSGSLYRWEFERGKKSVEIAVNGPLIVNDADLALAAAIDGVGITYLIDPRIDALLASGRLVRVLQAWSPPFPGLYLYYMSKRLVPPPLQAFIDFLRAEGIIAGGSAARARSAKRG